MALRRVFSGLALQVALTLGAVAAGFLYTGDVAGAVTVLLLGVFEVSLSFDNAVVNAVVLQRMSPFWQRMFLVVGVLVAAVGMRFLFPILITSLTSGLSFGSVIDLALHNPVEYQLRLEDAHIDINTLGGTFLGLVFLGFFLNPEDDQVHWIRFIERPLARAGQLESAALLVVLGGVLIDSRLVAPEKQIGMLSSALIACVIYIAVKGLGDLLGGAGGQAVATGGLGTFIYLEVLDASFSFDGVIGAFAITDKVILIMLGLGIGALYIRTMTIYFVEHGTLSKFAYLANGAHWAIGVLAALLFVNNSVQVPELLTGVIGALVIGASVLHSMRSGGDAEEEGGEPERLSEGAGAIAATGA